MAHPVAIDDRIDNVAAGDTTQTPHPHRQITFSDVEQIITDHETVTSGAVHGTLPMTGVKQQPTLDHLLTREAMWMPEAPPHHLRVFAVNRRVAY
jgi:hypothetical protein